MGLDDLKTIANYMYKLFLTK